VPSYSWLPEPLRRIRDPFREAAPEKVRMLLDGAMDQIEADPYNPGMPQWPYKRGNVPNSFIVRVGGRLWIHYQVFRDFPVLGLIAILDDQPPLESSSVVE